MLKFEEYMPFATAKAAKIMNDAFNNVVLKYGLTRSQCIAMYYINSAGSTNQKDLAKQMNIRESTMTGLLDRMERDGLIERKPDKEDMRRKSISLSKKGVEELDNISHVSEEFIKEATDKIDDESIGIFNKVLDKMVESVLEWQDNKIKSIE
ncbi:MAG: MarR family transcriptional regulator [Anaerococcus sp.]|uniref:MarR family winged helix-turn-helix transcriptional regulator n=1 Tax=Anaerococcus sp. TaxID=1872515 RepID=UPI00262F7751|nr:MarR family transcriptional regulator [Anaerococcus sp.]MCI5971841.1 MarR family transcriptional regulator [Anaerococcus sp.]MDD6918686.1 MarR family transcriptional regulator [Peptoniphilaceae bacterium]MDY2928165.1 MarR family transcriptional regulator [Anaerococcus sp.]